MSVKNSKYRFLNITILNNLLIILFLSIQLFCNTCSFALGSSKEITVVSDDNYPPYIFRDEKGILRGIVVDQWNLWQQKTGIKVHLFAMNWSNAQQFFNSGKADVLETAFYTALRAERWKFGNPYAVLEVPVFFNKSLSGISDIESLHGFTIGVKKGDACIDIFNSKGINTLKEYPSYDSIILAASKGEIKVFCIDKPPAIYYLYKYNLESEFNTSFTLYSGKFHRAVLKENSELMKLIEDGFYKITELEYKEINEKWMGKPILNNKFKEYVSISIMILLFAAFILLFFNFILRKRVKTKTNELKKAIQDISYNEEKFRTIFNSVNDTIFIHSLINGKIIEINSTAEKMYGYSKDELLKLKIQDVSSGVSPYSQKEAMDFILKATKNPQIFEWHARHKDGNLFWVEVSISYNATVFKDAVIVVVRDISERKKAEIEIKEFNALLEKKVDERTKQLKDANKELEAFAYTVSHDLRAPLRAIDGFTRILIEDHTKDLSEEGIKVSNVIIRNAKKMGQLIDDLLAFSRVNRYEMSKLQVDMQFIVDTVCKELITDDLKAKIKIEIGELPKVIGDRSLLKQVWTNLISNAIKFSSKKENPEIKINCEITDHEYIYSVSDNGAGFDNELADKLFGVFNRLHSNQEFEGTGVGLAIVQRIIQRHQGEVWAEAEIDKGAKFYFKLERINNQI